jgi:RimJ/RimL family protein N-acetyltransferase
VNPFETARLLFRPLIWDDLDDMYTLYRNPQVMQWISGEPTTYSATKKFLARHIEDHQQYGFGMCVALLKSNRKIIGRCGLFPVEKESGLEGDIAWMFQPDYWGQGLATEFAHSMIEIGFTQLSLRRIFATAASQNLASIRIMQKVGMQLVQEGDRGVEYEIYPTGNLTDNR